MEYLGGVSITDNTSDHKISRGLEASRLVLKLSDPFEIDMCLGNTAGEPSSQFQGDLHMPSHNSAASILHKILRQNVLSVG